MREWQKSRRAAQPMQARATRGSVGGGLSLTGGLFGLPAQAGNRAISRILSDRTLHSPVVDVRELAIVARQAAPTAAPAEEAPAITDEDKEEFNLLKGKIRKNNKKATKIKTVKDYVAYREDFFGPRENYQAEKATADAEFDAMPKKVWNKIGQKESKAAKKALYRWVRKAYVDAGITDPVSVIKAGMTEELKTKLAEVKKAHPGLKTGGFVARPQKLGGYRLGTISTAPARPLTSCRRPNPHIPVGEWKVVLEMAGMSVDRQKARWKKDPAGLWQDFHDVNAAYVAELAKRVANVQRERTAAGREPDNPPAFADVLAGNPKLIETAHAYGIGHGIFDLDKTLVTEFAAQGFLWGATFRNPDLHHFEIP